MVSYPFVFTPREATTQGNVVVMGSLSKDIIRGVMKEHAKQLTACHERALAKTPGLAGKIAVKFVIAADGTVRDTQITESMHSAAVETCVMAEIQTWTFPKPKGGGIVIVNFPLVFRNPR
jgi:TonB family protein